MSNYKTCPYNNIEDNAYFKNTRQLLKSGFLTESKLSVVSGKTKLLSFGSCFAARLSSMIKDNDLIYLQDNSINDSDGDAVKFEGKNEFSLPTGNIYSSRHLLQLLQRATGQITAEPITYGAPSGRLRNSFRPSILSYANEGALRRDDLRLLEKLLSMVKEADIFFFTLGLTESWFDSETHLVLARAPGCGYGEFDPSRHYFHDLSYTEVCEDLFKIHTLLKSINPNLILALTLSPVPLTATYKKMSAVEATYEAKSVLRAAISGVISKQKDILYFPSYELVMNHFSFEKNFNSENRREVSSAAVSLVSRDLKTFLGLKANDEPEELISPIEEPNETFNLHFESSIEFELPDIDCDENEMFESLVTSQSTPEDD